MRVFGITYDTGFSSGGMTTHEPFDPEVVRRELQVIHDDLHCDAVRVTGAVQDRLETAARLATEAGLEVWYAPFTNGLSSEQLVAFLLDGASRAERLRRDGASVVFMTGSEISLFNGGFLPGDTHDERLQALMDPGRRAVTIPAARAGVNAFLARAVAEVRSCFGGPVSYASLPFEGVDWSPFDIPATMPAMSTPPPGQRFVPACGPRSRRASRSRSPSSVAPHTAGRATWARAA